MTVQELIEKLQAIEDKSVPVLMEEPMGAYDITSCGLVYDYRNRKTTEKEWYVSLNDNG